MTDLNFPAEVRDVFRGLIGEYGLTLVARAPLPTERFARTVYLLVPGKAAVRLSAPPTERFLDVECLVEKSDNRWFGYSLDRLLTHRGAWNGYEPDRSGAMVARQDFRLAVRSELEAWCDRLERFARDILLGDREWTVDYDTRFGEPYRLSSGEEERLARHSSEQPLPGCNKPTPVDL
jgi:hypothetical protein